MACDVTVVSLSTYTLITNNKSTSIDRIRWRLCYLHAATEAAVCGVEILQALASERKLMLRLFGYSCMPGSHRSNWDVPENLAGVTATEALAEDKPFWCRLADDRNGGRFQLNASLRVQLKPPVVKLLNS